MTVSNICRRRLENSDKSGGTDKAQSFHKNLKWSKNGKTPNNVVKCDGKVSCEFARGLC